MLDTATSIFTTVATTGDAASGDYKYTGAPAVGDKVYCARVHFVAHRRRFPVVDIAGCGGARGGDGCEDICCGVKHTHVVLGAVVYLGTS